MILSFDKFERYEVPQVTLCNPNSRATEIDGKITITDTVGVLSNPKGMNLKLNFNAPHELSFDYYRYKSSDPIKQSFYDSIYEAIQTDRYIYLTDIGYFVISSVTDSDEDNIDKKSITCKSCEENELATAEGLYLKEGTYYLHTEDNQGLLDLFLPKIAGWTIGFIDPSLLTKPYFIEETEVDNGYNFLYTTIQDMFECIAEPDIIRRNISVYSRAYYAEHHLTDIHIAKHNLLKHKTVEENDEDKYTALNVQGKDENLEIRAVNPTGKNVIYNFEPRYSWMSPALQQAVEKWQEKCESVEEEYLTLQQGYYTELEKLFNEEQDIAVLKGELKTLEEARDAVIITVGEQQSTALDNVNTQISIKQTEINTATSAYDAHKESVRTTYEIPIDQINSDCALDLTAIDINGNSIFTTDLLNELMTYIKPTDYVDEYMLVTESMTYSQRFEKAKELMDRAQSQLIKISSGQKTYSIDTRSFLFNKQFRHFSEQLCAGAIIYVETKNDIMEQLHLTGIDINFDEKSTNFTLGNKYNRSDLKALYEDALGQNSKSFSELKYIASIIEDQQKQLDYQRNWVADLRTLTLDNVLISEDQAIEINNRGLTGRKRQLNEDGSWKTDTNGNPLFYSEQVKLINNTLVFTDDNWQTAKTAVGKIAVGHNPDETVKYAYGINGQVLIGELILGNNLVLTGTGAGIKITDGNGNDAFYADDDGNLVLRGRVTATSGDIAGWQINSQMLSKSSGDYYFYLQSNPYTAENDMPYNPVIAVRYQNDYKFFVRSNGYLFAKNAEIEGSITATTGSIGGWKIDYNVKDAAGNYNGYYLSYNNDQVYLCPQGRGTGNTAIYVNGNFTVSTNGDICAYSGQIGGWDINSNMLSKSYGDYYFYLQSNPYTDGNAIPYNPVIAVNYQNDDKFYVRSNGHLFAKDAEIQGTITATGGAIGGWNLVPNYWNASLLYTKTGAGNYGTGMAGANNADFGSYAFPAFWAGYTGNYAHPYAASDNKEDWGSKTGFYVTHDGHLVANSATIKGTINSESIISNDVYLGSKNTDNKYNLILQSASNGVSGAAIRRAKDLDWKADNEGNTYFELTTYGLTVHIPDDTIESETWTNIYRAAFIASDKNCKNTIEEYSNKYDTFFDLLQPCRFKFNSRQKDKFWMGFIAQDVESALYESNLSSCEFGGLEFFQTPQLNGSQYNLDKREFIALNTWQIQKAKSRITELENEIVELKTQIKTLTAG